MRLFRRFKYLLDRNRRERELAEELAFHAFLAEREQRESGLAPEAARRATSLQLGNTTLAREAAHHIWFPAAIEGVFQDLRYAWRGLSRSKALVAVACLSLGLSTGFGTALVSVVNAVVLQPVTASRPDAMVRVWVGGGNRISGLNLHDICDSTPGVACSGYSMNDFMLNQVGEPIRLRGQVVSPHYFSMLGIDQLWSRTPGHAAVADRCSSQRLTGQRGSQVNDLGTKVSTKAVPLSQLAAVDSDASTAEAIGDWRYWVARGYCLQGRPLSADTPWRARSQQRSSRRGHGEKPPARRTPDRFTAAART